MESESQMNNVGDNSGLNGGVFGSDGHGGGSHDGNRVGDGGDGHRGGNRRDDGPGVGDVYGDLNTGGSRNTNTGSPHPFNTNTGTPLRSQVYELILHELANLHRVVSEIGRAASKIDGNVSGKVDTIISFLSEGNDPAPPRNQAAWHRNMASKGFQTSKRFEIQIKKEYEHPDFVKDRPERFEFIKPRPRTTTKTAVLPHTPHPSNTNTGTPLPSNTNTGTPLPSNTGTPHRSQEYELILHDMVNLHREVSEIGRVVSKIDGNYSAKLETLISFLSGGNPPAPQDCQAEWHRNSEGHRIHVQSASEGATRLPKRQCRRNSTEHMANDPIQALDNELGMGACNLNAEDMLPPLFENDQG